MTSGTVLRVCALAVATLTAACAPSTPGPVCTPGASSACTCAEGRFGTQVCRDDGARLDPCQCTGTGSDGGMSFCGDTACDAGESCSSCPSDCGACAPSCGDSVCAASESCTSCPSDCGACAPTCGDFACNASESCSSCPGDCGACAPSCGDFVCNASESCSSCPGDCGACPPSCTASTCGGGCCSGTACMPGDSNAACGTGGSACSACDSHSICSEGLCYIDPESRWTIVVDTLTLTATDYSGASWDIGSGPDALIWVRVGSATAPPVEIDGPDNTLSITYTTANRVTNRSAADIATLLRFEIWEDDSTGDDGVCFYTYTGMDGFDFSSSTNTATCIQNASTGVSAMTLTWHLERF